MFIICVWRKPTTFRLGSLVTPPSTCRAANWAKDMPFRAGVEKSLTDRLHLTGITRSLISLRGAKL